MLRLLRQKQFGGRERRSQRGRRDKQMAKGTWKVQSNFICGEWMYIPCRVRNTDEVVHSGNIEHYGEYTTNLDEARALADKLNAKEYDEK